MKTYPSENLTLIDESLAESLFCRGVPVYKVSESAGLGSVPVANEKNFLNRDLDFSGFSLAPGIKSSDYGILNAHSCNLKSDLNRELRLAMEREFPANFEDSNAGKNVCDSIRNIKDSPDFDVSASEFLSLYNDHPAYERGFDFLKNHSDIKTSFAAVSDYFNSELVTHLQETSTAADLKDNIKFDLSFVENRSDLVMLIERYSGLRDTFAAASERFDSSSFEHILYLSKSHDFDKASQVLDGCLKYETGKAISTAEWEQFIELSLKGYGFDRTDPLYPGLVQLDNLKQLTNEGRAVLIENNSRADLLLDGVPGFAYYDANRNSYFVPDEQFLEKGLPLDFSNSKDFELTGFLKSSIENFGLHPEIRSDLLQVKNIEELDSLRSSYTDAISRFSKDINSPGLELSDVGLLIYEIEEMSEAVRFIDFVYDNHIKANSMSLYEWNEALQMARGDKVVSGYGYITVDLNEVRSLDSSRLRVSDEGKFSLDGMKGVAVNDFRLYFDLDNKTYFDLVSGRVIENYALRYDLYSEGSMVLNSHQLDYLKDKGLLEVTEKNFFDGLDRCCYNGMDVILETCYEQDGYYFLYEESNFFENLYPELNKSAGVEMDSPFDVDGFDEGMSMD